MRSFYISDNLFKSAERAISDHPGYDYVISIMSLYRIIKIAAMGASVGISGSDVAPLCLTVLHNYHALATGYTVVLVG